MELNAVKVYSVVTNTKIHVPSSMNICWAYLLYIAYKQIIKVFFLASWKWKINPTLYNMIDIMYTSQARGEQGGKL